MTDLAPQIPEGVLRRYVRAKDENRPHLLDRVFAPDAILEISNASDAIDFPATTSGRDAITDVLVRSFGQTYENIYTFCLERPHELATAFECGWLVAMTEKRAARDVRVGCGRYAWRFDPRPPGLASRLLITILEMRLLPAAEAAAVLSGIEGLSYPWSSVAEIEALAARQPLFGFVCRHVRATPR